MDWKTENIPLFFTETDLLVLRTKMEKDYIFFSKTNASIQTPKRQTNSTIFRQNHKTKEIEEFKSKRSEILNKMLN